jgi:hypothetical protein
LQARSAAQHVVGGIQSEIVAKSELAASQPEMDVVTAGGANSSGETEAN